MLNKSKSILTQGFKKLMRGSIIFIIFAFSQQNALATPFTDLYVFGDSLSENGNLQGLLGPGVPDRFTNGPTATEILAAQMGLVLAPSFFSPDNPTTDGLANNYAFAGGRARDVTTSVFPVAAAPFLALQTGQAIAQAGGILDAGALYLIFIGGNDIGDALDAGPDAFTVIGEAVSAILDSILDLQTAGAMNFLVVNAPDVGDTPLVQSSGLGAVGFADLLVGEFNSLLSAGLSGMAGVSIFDTVAFAENYISSGGAAADGITDFTTACSNITPILCADNSFFYADPFHPTAPVHAAFGKALINAARVPEPAPIALLGLGLLVLGLMRRRKA